MIMMYSLFFMHYYSIILHVFLKRIMQNKELIIINYFINSINILLKYNLYKF